MSLGVRVRLLSVLEHWRAGVVTASVEGKMIASLRCFKFCDPGACADEVRQ